MRFIIQVYWFLIHSVNTLEAKYIVNFHQNRVADHDKRTFYEDVCLHPVISSDELQIEWTCSDKPIGELGYPRGTICNSKCRYGTSALSGTSSRIECVDRRPQYGNVAREWNPRPLFCKSVTCETKFIREKIKSSRATWEPEACVLQQKVRVGTECKLRCTSPLFSDLIATCKGDGHWAGSTPTWALCAPASKEDKKIKMAANGVKQTNHDHMVEYTLAEGYPMHTEDTIQDTVSDSTIKKRVDTILKRLNNLTSSSSAIIIILVLSSMSAILLALVILACICCCRTNNKMKYALIDNRGQQLLPVTQLNSNNNSKHQRKSRTTPGTACNNQSTAYHEHPDHNCRLYPCDSKGLNKTYKHKKVKGKHYQKLDTTESSDSSTYQSGQNDVTKRVTGVKLLWR